MLKGALSFALFTVLHAVVTLTLLVFSFSAGMKAFDDPSYEPPAGAVASTAVLEVLMLPLAPLWSRWASTRMPDVFEFAFFALNSGMWGFALAVLWCRSVESRPGGAGRGTLVAGVLGGTTFLAIALLAALAALGIDGYPDDVIIELNGTYADGALRTVVALVLSVALGASGVFLLLRSWRERRAGVLTGWTFYIPGGSPTAPGEFLRANRSRVSSEALWLVGSISAAVALCMWVPEYGLSPVPFFALVFYALSGIARLIGRLFFRR